MIEIFDCEQRSEAWYKARLGIPTASEFQTVLRDVNTSKTYNSYIKKLAGERLTGEPMKHYQNTAMDRGHAMEDEALDKYAFLKDTKIEKVGFIKDTKLNAGCSPDGLISKDGMVEIKTAEPHILIDIILADKFPAEHVAQSYGNLYISGRQWIDIGIYWPKMPMFVKRLHRNEQYDAELLSAINRANREIEKIVQAMNALMGS